MRNGFVGGIYLIILNAEILDKFDFFFPRIIFSVKRALRSVKYFLNILFVVSNEKEDRKSRLSDEEIRYLLLRLLFYFYSFSCSISLDESLRHLKVQVFPLVVPFLGVLSKSQTNVLQDFFSTKHMEFYEECGTKKEIGIFHCKLIRNKGKKHIPFSTFEWNVFKEIKRVIFKTQVSCIELPLLVNENVCHFELTPPELSFFKLHETIAVGGTFDHLHEGHQLLLNAAVLLAKKNTVICIVQDNSFLLSNKKVSFLLHPCLYRVTQLYQYILRFLCFIGEPEENVMFSKELMKCCLMNTRLAENKFIEMLNGASSTVNIGVSASKNPNGFFMNSLMGHFVISSNLLNQQCCEQKKSVELLALNDAVGPAANRSDFTCLIVTPDTQKGGIVVNNERQANKLKPLDIIILPFIEPLILLESFLQKPLFSRHTNGWASHVLPKNELQINGCFSKTDGQQNGMFYTNEVKKKTLSSTQIRQKFLFHSPIRQLYEWWLSLCTIAGIPSNISRVWGQCFLCRMLDVPWREKTIIFLRKCMNFYWQKTIRVQKNLKEKSFVLICLWFFCLVDATFFDDLPFEKNTLALHSEIIVQTVNKIIESFCNDLYWFSDKNVQHHWRSKLLCSNNHCQPKNTDCFLTNCTCIHASILPSSTTLALEKYALTREIFNLVDLHNNLCHVVYCMVNQAWLTKNPLKMHHKTRDVLVPGIFPTWIPLGLTFYFEKLYPYEENIPLIVFTLFNNHSVKEILKDHSRHLVTLMPVNLFENLGSPKF